jgi:hypothetical protein
VLPRVKLFVFITGRSFIFAIDRIIRFFLKCFIFAVVLWDSPLGVAGGNPMELAELARRSRQQAEDRQSVFRKALRKSLL